MSTQAASYSCRTPLLHVSRCWVLIAVDVLMMLHDCARAPSLPCQLHVLQLSTGTAAREMGNLAHAARRPLQLYSQREDVKRAASS